MATTRRSEGAPRVVVIGGGFGGIAMGVKLRRAGIDSFVILEAEAGPGGTWWSNRYPGAEVDVHSSIYSYSFGARTWTRTHARQDELLRYIVGIVHDFDLERHFRFNTRAESVVWDDERRLHRVTTAAGEVFEAEVVVSAVGMLSDPKLPNWPGFEDFRGEVFHTSRWDETISVVGKTIGVIGVGSTASQLVPEVAKEAKRLYVFQREPGWVLPKGGRDYSPEEMEKYRSRFWSLMRRYRHFFRSEWAHTYHPIYVIGSKRHRRGEQIARDYIERVFSDRPDLRDAVTPQYEFGGKRRVLVDDYYEALLRPNVELITGGVSAFATDGVVTGSGRAVSLDAVVLATGFRAQEYLSSLTVAGRGGRVLAEEWREYAHAFLGMMVPGFPNLFIMYGPNTNGGAPITAMLERQADFVVAQLRRMRSRNWSAIEVKRAANERYQRWIQGRMAGTAWLQGNNYFRAPNGRVVTQWRDSSSLYSAMLKLLRIPATTDSDAIVADEQREQTRKEKEGTPR